MTSLCMMILEPAHPDDERGRDKYCDGRSVIEHNGTSYCFDCAVAVAWEGDIFPENLETFFKVMGS